MIPTLNLTTDDVERGSYESSKQVIVDNFVTRKVIRNDYGQTPSYVFKSKLLELMLAECAKNGVVVVKAPAGYGKSIAAKTILQYSPGGIMFRNCQDDITSYSQGMAEALGVPRVVYERTSKWRHLLVDAVAAIEKNADGRYRQTRQESWLDRAIDRITSMSVPYKSTKVTGSQDDPGEPLRIDFDDASLKKLKKRKKGILIFDDFNDVKESDVDFMKSFYPVAEGADILVFIMVHDNSTANRLLKLNGWCRLFPLREICTDSMNLPTGVDGKEPNWITPSWTEENLIKLVRANCEGITEDQLAKLDIRDGLEPYDLLARARELLQEDD